MKATTIIIAAILSLQVSTLFAANEFPPVTSNNDANAFCCGITLVPIAPAIATFEDDATFDINQLMPTTPTEASFEDMPSEMKSTIDLAPVTPDVAYFSDVVPETNFNLIDLALVTPALADFDDAVVVNSFDNVILAPVTLSEADFE